MRIVTISDTHERHKKVTIPDGDMLIIVGDVTEGNDARSLVSFNKWLGTLSHKYKIMIAGNHDRYFESHPQEAKEKLTNAIYLYESGIEIEGIKIWGSPWTPEFLNWSFMISPGKAKERWEKMPDKVDILITHGPPWGKLDYVPRTGKSEGDNELLKKVMDVHPMYHIFGHLHYGYGKAYDSGTHFINTSICTENYEPINPPQIIDYYR